MDWTRLPQDRVMWVAVLKNANESLGSVKDDGFLDLLSFSRTLLHGVSSIVKKKVLRRELGP
jgi:hypothetical protein